MTLRPYWLALVPLLLAAAPPPSVFTVRVKMGKKLVPVGEVTRTADGKVSVRGLPAPAIDKLADDFVAAWKAYKLPPSVSITESIASDTGMRPSYAKHTFVFTPGDRLYLPAVLREFVNKRGAEALGMRSIRFVDFDRTAETPEGANDRASKTVNIRKGTGTDDEQSFYIKVPVRPVSMGEPTGVLRASGSQPSIAVAQNQDDGTVLVAWVKISEAGKVEVEPFYAGARFVSAFSTFDGTQEEVVSLIHDAKDWKSIVVKPGSPWLLEAHLVRLEQGNFYDITPVIDPALLK